MMCKKGWQKFIEGAGVSCKGSYISDRVYLSKGFIQVECYYVFQLIVNIHINFGFRVNFLTWLGC